MTYSLSRAAATDLEDIVAFGIGQFGEGQALRYEASLRRVFELLAAFPAMGRASSALGNDGRGFVHGPHVIFYRALEGGVVIDRILPARQLGDGW